MRCPSAVSSVTGIVIARSVPQSTSRTMTSCDTSTRRRVRYPESAVRSAVSARPLRVPCVEMKYSSTDRPSRKLALIGRGMYSPFGLATRPRIPASCRTWVMLPAAPDWTISGIGLSAGKFSSIARATSSDACDQILTISSLRSWWESAPRW